MFFFRCCAAGGGDKNFIERHSYSVEAQNTDMYSVFASLYNTLRKDVEQNTLSQASMPFATMPKTLVFAVFLRLCTTYCTRMWIKGSCHKRPCLWRPCPKD